MEMNIDNLSGNVFNANEIKRTLGIIKQMKKYADAEILSAFSFLIIGNDKSLANMIALDLAEKSGAKFITVHSYNNKTLEQNCKLLYEEGEPRIIYFENINKFECNDEYALFKCAVQDCFNRNIFVIATLSDDWCTKEEMLKIRAIKDCFGRRIILPKYQGNMIAKELFKSYKIGANTDQDFMSRIYTYQNYDEVKKNLDDAAIRAMSRGDEFISEKDMYYSVLGIDDDLLNEFTDNISNSDIETCVYAVGKALVIESLYPGSLIAVSAVDNGYPEACYGNILCDYIKNHEFKDDKYNQYMISIAGKEAVNISLEYDINEHDNTVNDFSALSDAEKTECINTVKDILISNKNLLDNLGSELINTGFVTGKTFNKLRKDEALLHSVMLYGIVSDDCNEIASLQAYIYEGCLVMEGVEESPAIKERFGRDEYAYDYIFDEINTSLLSEVFKADDLLSALIGFFHGEHRDADFYKFCE